MLLLYNSTAGKLQFQIVRAISVALPEFISTWIVIWGAAPISSMPYSCPMFLTLIAFSLVATYVVFLINVFSLTRTVVYQYSSVMLLGSYGEQPRYSTPTKNITQKKYCNSFHGKYILLSMSSKLAYRNILVCSFLIMLRSICIQYSRLSLLTFSPLPISKLKISKCPHELLCISTSF